MSMKLTPAAPTLTTTCPGPAVGTGSASSSIASGPPYWWTRIACIVAIRDTPPRDCVPIGTAGSEGRRTPVCQARRFLRPCGVSSPRASASGPRRLVVLATDDQQDAPPPQLHELVLERHERV